MLATYVCSELFTVITVLVGFTVHCRGFAKRTLLKTAKKAGIKAKEGSSKRQKYIITATPPMMRRSFGGTLPNSDTLTSDTLPQQQLAMFDDDLSGLTLSKHSTFPTPVSTSTFIYSSNSWNLSPLPFTVYVEWKK